MEIDIDELRSRLTDYCGTAAFAGMPAAIIDMIDVESASPTELFALAQRLDLDLLD